MRLTAPKKIVFWISLVLAVLGLVAKFVAALGLASFAFWFVLAGFVLLAAGVYFKGF